jgi:FkbM family methyltransferase
LSNLEVNRLSCDNNEIIHTQCTVALDGEIFSNTKFYSDKLGWTGLLIEPQEDYYNRLVKNRRSTTNMHAAICRSPGTIEIIGSGGMAGRVDKISTGATDMWSKTTAKPVPVSCAPISKYIKEAGITRVDFFSLDVEGSEFEVLSTYPFDFIPTYAILIELSGQSEKNDQCRKLLKDNGFVYLENIGHGNSNEVWVNDKNRLNK